MRNARLYLLVSAAAILAGCVGGPNDRCFVDDLRYHEARRVFERTQSTELTRQALQEQHWPNAMINECIYRIEKEFGLNDSLPSPVKIRSEAELQAEQKMEQEEQAQKRKFGGVGGGARGV
ncbi:MAG: hypothetical protein NTW86_28315 [Candidatus Sumerlaeota bacterium]|nr:hypothetical protein [Candidatus Sumerlaeota bacterium]